MGVIVNQRVLVEPLAALKLILSERLRRAERGIGAIDLSISPSLSNALDILRSLAAFFVVINHLGEVLFLFDRDLDLFNLLAFQSLYLGHHSVMILFVVSGFLIGRAAVQSVSKGGRKIFDYGIDRITRIYVVLIPALLIGFVSDQILMHVYSGAEFDYLRERTSFLIFLGNIFGLQTVFVPTFGSNGPLWSLACELWYYFMFPAFLIAWFGKSLRSRLIGLVGFVAALFIVSGDILHYAVIWCLGVACWLPKRSLAPKWLGWSLLALFLVSANNEFLWANGWGFPHIAGTALTVALIINSHRHDRAVKKDRHGAISKFFAKFTYSLYLYHYPPLMIVLALLLKNDFVPFGHMGPQEAAATTGLLVLLYAYSYAWFWLTERNYHHFRNFVRMKAAPLRAVFAPRV